MTAATVAMAAPWLLGFGGYINSIAVDVHVDVVRYRHALLLGQLAEESRGAGEQGEAAQQLERQAEVGEHGAAGTRAVERQRPAEDLRVDPANRLEQSQVRAAEPLFFCDLDEHRSARVADLVHRVAEAGDELLRRPRLLDGCQRELVVPRVIGGNLARFGEDPGEELAGVLGHAEEPGAAAEQARRERALK